MGLNGTNLVRFQGVAVGGICYICIMGLGDAYRI